MRLREIFKKVLPRLRRSGQMDERLSSSSAPADQVPEAQKLAVFDWRFYLSYYPELRSRGVTNQRRATRHWLNHGFAEGRLGGPQHPTFQANLRHLNAYLQQVGSRAQAAGAALAGRTPPLINILTRSNRRPRFFQDNRNSVAGQDYKKVRQLVSYENPETLRYLSESGIPEGDLIRVVRKQTEASHAYNLFVNDLMNQVTEGWIMFLDDDDLFTTPHALSIIAAQLQDENSLVCWCAWFPDKIVPATKDINAISEGGITSCCFAFHSRHRKHAQWHEFKAGDYRCFDQLRQQLQPVFLDDILTKVNYTDRSAGWGEARDKQP